MKATPVEKAPHQTNNSFWNNGLIGVVFILWLAIFSFGQAPVLEDPDSAWHIAAGDLIREMGALPAHDPWSFTAGETRWYNISWLFDVVVSLLHETVGLYPLYALTILAFAALGAWMARMALVRGAWSFVTIFIALLMAFQVYSGVLMRPNLVSVILIVIFYSVLSAEERGVKHYPVWLLPALTTIWVNCHGGVLGGLILIAIFFLAASWENNQPRMKRLLLIGILCGLATLINPYGYKVYEGMVQTLGSSFAKQSITEWKSFQAGNIGHLIVFLFLILCLLTTPFTRRALALGERITLFVWLMMAMLSIRHSVILGMIAIPSLSIAITERLRELRWGDMLARKAEEYRRDFATPAARKAVLVVCAVWVMVLASPYPLRAVLPEAGMFSADRLPIEEIAYIRKHYPKARFLNDYNIGGFLVYGGRGEPKLFVDGRADTAYPKEVLEDYADFTRHAGLDEKGAQVLRKYKIDGLILWNESEEMDLYKSQKRWRVAFEGKAATVLVRR